MSTELTVRDRLNSDEFKGQIAAVLPKHMTPERMVRVACTALLRTPDLARCYQPSFFKCMLDLSAAGLEPDGRLAHLIPFMNNKENRMECQLIIDYKGLVQLALRHPDVVSVSADIVCQNDEFVCNKKQIAVHRVDYKQPRGDMYAAWAEVVLRGGRVVTEVMTKEEIDSIRARSKAGKSGPWVTDYNEMSKKTVFRRLSKWIPLSSEIRDAFEKDFDSLEDDNAPFHQRKAPPKNLESLTSAFAKESEPSESESAPESSEAEVAGA